MRNLLIIIILFYSCVTQKQNYNQKDDYEILLKVLNREKVKILKINNGGYLTSDSRRKPEEYLNRYKNALEMINKDKRIDSLMTALNGKVEWIFTKDDIKYMKVKYKDWHQKTWNKNLIPKNIEIFEGKRLPSKTNTAIYKISQPLYNKKINNAFVMVFEYKSSQDMFMRIILLKKINKDWNIVGRLFSGHY